MKLTVLDAHNDDFNSVAQLSRANRLRYCDYWDFNFVHYHFDKLEPEGRQPHWGRYQGILKHLPDCDWLFYLDTDAIITNIDVNVKDYIDDKYDMIVGPLPHEGHLSTGAFLLKNTPWSLAFAQEIWDQTQFIKAPWHGTLSGGDGAYLEQSAFHYLYDTRPDHREHIKVVERRRFNSLVYTHDPFDLLVHFPGREDRTKLMQMFLDGNSDEARTEAVAYDKKIRDIYTRAAGPVKRSKVIGKPRLKA